MRHIYAKVGIMVSLILMLCILLFFKRIQNVPTAEYAEGLPNVVLRRTKLPWTHTCNSSVMHLQGEISQYTKLKRKLTDSEQKAAVVCKERDLQKEHKHSWDTFFANKVEYIRWNNHTYLNGDSTVIEVGGNVGSFSDNIQRLYKPRRYIILEPINQFSDMLIRKYQNVNNIVVLNFGLASEDRIDWVKIHGLGTSRFLSGKTPNDSLVPLRQVNAANFFLSMGVGFFEVDLLTMNCEGCEYDILDAILDSNLINYFRHVQISFHHLNGLGDTLDRWCQCQQLLSRTHRLTYQYPLFWESWTRKDLR